MKILPFRVSIYIYECLVMFKAYVPFAFRKVLGLHSVIC